MSKYWSKLHCLKGGGSLLAQISGEKGVVHQRILASENYSPWAITWCCLRDPKFSRFDTIPACDTHRQTDRQTDMIMAITRTSLMSRG